MRKKLLDFMQGRFGLLWCMAVLLSAMFPAKALLAGQEQVDCPPLAGAQGVDKCSLSEAHPTEICKLLTNKTASEKAQIKSREIAKRDFKGKYTNTQYGVRVEIIGEVKEININGQSGIELFAKAWRGDKQLGFGKDGSVEIERFRIFNPPILVDDTNGDIVREWTDKETGELKQRKLREYPREAIRLSLAHTIKIVGKENNNITVGKVGNTTSTFYPDAGDPGLTSVDGYVQRVSDCSTWSNVRDGGGTAAYAAGTSFSVGLNAAYCSGTWYIMSRAITLFNTSAIGSTSTITSATYSLWNLTKRDELTPSGAMSVVTTNPASNTTLAASDYLQTGDILQAPIITLANITTNAYNDFALNSTGLSNISKTGVTKFGMRLDADRTNTEPTYCNCNSDASFSSADTIGTTQDPKLVVVHSAPTSSGTITRVVNGGNSILGGSSLTMNLTITGSNLILFVSTLKQNSETITGVTWNGVPLTQVESVISYTTNNVQLWYLLAPAVGTYDLVTTASGSSGYIITYYALYSGVKQTGQLDGSTRVTGNTPITATITTGTDNTWAFLTSVQGGSAGTNATLIAIGDMRTYDNQGYGTIAPGTVFSMTVNLQLGYSGGVIMATFKEATPPATPTPTPTPTDTTAPSGYITINSGSSYTKSTSVTLNLSATDAVGVTGYYLSDTSSTPTASASGWTSVTSTTSYSASVSYTLSSGEGGKTIYAWYKDAAGNVSSTANATITLDTTVPTVTISSPTSSSTYTATSSTINLGGSASDSSSGISSVAWSNNRGGNGTATGTASWTVPSISLSSGDNVITVTAKDGANNSGTDTLQVTYGTSSTVSAPTVSTGSASSVTTSSATLNGTVNANGGTTTAWFQYGSTSGSYGNTSSTQTVTGSSNTTVSTGISGLSSGTTYYYRIAASNSGGTSYGSELSFTTTTATAIPIPTPSTGDSSAPTDGSITINSGASYTNSTGVTLTLSAKDNVGVTGYYLSSSSSTPSSSTSGWTSVSSTTTYSGSVSYTLSSGDGSKTVYVWFKDASGNVSSSASDDITLDTSVPAITITSPTSDVTYTATSSTISLGGSASDSTSGIKEVTWTISSGGSGTASGTTSWTISSISLSNGDTTITVTAKDNGGNTATDTITVTYKSTSTNIPKVSTGSATNVTESSATLSGTVNANGLTTTAWFN